MPLWTKTDSAAGAPKWKSIATGSGTPNRGNTLFANTTSGAFITGTTVGVFGANVTEAQALTRSVSPGWLKTSIGTGPALTVGVIGGTGFVNGSTITLSNGTTSGIATVITNGTGNATSAVVTTPGAGFIAPLPGPGTITTLTTSTGVTGVGTSFTTGLVGFQIYTLANVYVGTIASHTSATSVTLAANAAVALTANGYTLGTVASAFNRERFSNTIANATGGFTSTAFGGATEIGYVNGNIITVTGGVTALANATGGTAAGSFNGAALVGYVNGNIITISGARLAVNAVANISTNSLSGNIQLTIVNRGSLANGTVNQAFTYTISQGTGGSLGNTSVSMFGNSIVQTVLVPAVMNITSNSLSGNIQLAVQNGGGVFTNTTVNQAFTYTITQGTGASLGNTSVTMFGNTIMAGNSSGGVVGAITLGGQAGRIQRECLVVFKGMTGTGSTSP
jgi:hypothetical protein